MRTDDARAAVLAEWHTWRARELPADHRATGRDGLRFFAHLQGAHPELLKQRVRGDPWQHVHGWLLRADLVCD